MARHLYAIDFAVGDFDAAAAAFTDLTGIEGLPMWEGYDPTGTIRGIHFRLPGLEALGVMSPSDRPEGPVANDLSRELAARGDGAHIVCFEAHDLDDVQARLEAQGARFEYDQPLEVGDERFNMLTVAGVRITLAHHHPGHWDRWRNGSLRGQATPPPVRTPHRVTRTTVVDLAVHDPAPVTAALDEILGPSDAVTVTTGDGEECTGVIYPLTGMQALRVLHPVAGTSEGVIRRHLDRRGEGVARITFEVDDTATAAAQLGAAGVPLAEPTAGVLSTEPICGVVFVFTPA